MLRDISSSQRNTRLLGLAVNGTGTAVIGQGATDAILVRNGVGDYTITFTKPFARVPVIKGSSLTAVVNIQIFAKTKLAFQLKTFSVDGTTAKDAIIDILVFGSDAEDMT